MSHYEAVGDNLLEIKRRNFCPSTSNFGGDSSTIAVKIASARAEKAPFWPSKVNSNSFYKVPHNLGES